MRCRMNANIETIRNQKLNVASGNAVLKRRETIGFSSRPQLDSSGGDWHDANRTVLYWEYVEALIRIASILYNDTDGLPTLHEQFMHLIEAHINPHIKSLPAESSRMLVRHQWAQTPNKVIIDNMKEVLNKIFKSYSDNHADANNRTVTLRNILRALRDGGILRSGFGVKNVLPLIESVIFNESNYDSMDSDNLDTDVIFDDFLDILLKVSLAQEISNPVSESNEATGSDATTEVDSAVDPAVVVVAADDGGDETKTTSTGKDQVDEESGPAEEKSNTLDANDTPNNSTTSDKATDKIIVDDSKKSQLAVFLEMFVSKFTI